MKILLWPWCNTYWYRTSPLTGNWTKYVKQLFIDNGQQTEQNVISCKKKISWAVWSAQFWLGGTFWTVVKVGKTQAEQGNLIELRRTNRDWSFWRVKCLKFTAWERRGEMHIKRAIEICMGWGSHESSPIIIYTYERYNSLHTGKNYWKL